MILSQEIEKFLAFSQIQSAQFRIETVGPDVLKFIPKNIFTKMTLGYMALVHGNETVGLPILNQLLESLVNGEIEVDYEIYFAIGNLEAARKDVRFVEEDLNRCFGPNKSTSLEARRASELENTMLNHCDYLIDLHQTQRASLKPFFIFQYSSNRCLSILEKINPGLPTVLQTDAIGENTGLSTDEYLRSRGGFGTALELGEKADQTYLELGLEICKEALFTLMPLKYELSKFSASFNLPLYKLDGKFKAINESYQLDTTLKNFAEFKPGQKLGTSSNGDFFASEAGFLLFPRFQDVTAGCNLFHFCTPLQIKDTFSEMIKPNL